MQLTSPDNGTAPHTARAAAITLADHATNPADLRDLLETCGLITPAPIAGRGSNGRTYGRCPSCRRVGRLSLDGALIAHKGSSRDGGRRCPGGGKEPVRT